VEPMWITNRPILVDPRVETCNSVRNATRWKKRRPDEPSANARPAGLLALAIAVGLDVATTAALVATPAANVSSDREPNAPDRD
jgi:hypothetical protein